MVRVRLADRADASEHVSLENVLSVVSNLALGAFKRLFTKVTPFVVSHVAFSPEALAALLRAGKGPLVVMNPHVDAQVLFFRESFTTARAWALERLCAVV